MFLREHAPEILAELSRGLALATVRCSCDYVAELEAFDEVVLRMRLGGVVQNRITLTFEYWRQSAGGEELVARGEQVVACMRREETGTVPTPIPPELREALKPYA
jgi:enediyne biosynthesis thioesterase